MVVPASLLGLGLVTICVGGGQGTPAPRMLTTKGRNFVDAEGAVVLLGGTDVVVKVGTSRKCPPSSALPLLR